MVKVRNRKGLQKAIFEGRNISARIVGNTLVWSNVLHEYDTNISNIWDWDSLKQCDQMIDHIICICEAKGLLL